MKILQNILLLIIVSFLLHVIWESLHVSLYGGYEHLSPVLSVTVWATIGDVAYTLFVYLLIALIKKDFYWLQNIQVNDYVALTLMGFFIALFVEYKALFFERWFYLDAMPIIPFLNVGLSPVLQMTLLLPLTMYLTHRIFVYAKQKKIKFL